MNFPKLVRDKIPEIIETSGKSHSIRFVHGREADKFLIRKMIEEVSEFEETPCVEEAADIYEVFLAFLDNWNLDISDVKNAANEKKVVTFWASMWDGKRVMWVGVPLTLIPQEWDLYSYPQGWDSSLLYWGRGRSLLSQRA